MLTEKDIKTLDEKLDEKCKFVPDENDISIYLVTMDDDEDLDYGSGDEDLDYQDDEDLDYEDDDLGYADDEDLEEYEDYEYLNDDDDDWDYEDDDADWRDDEDEDYRRKRDSGKRRHRKGNTDESDS